MSQPPNFKVEEAGKNLLAVAEIAALGWARSPNHAAIPLTPMNQIKIFKGLEDDTTTIEHDVNEWLRSNDVRVVQIFGNVAPQTTAPETVKNTLTRTSHPPSDVLLVVLYERA